MQAPLAECQKGVIREVRGSQAVVALKSSGHCQGCPTHNICHPFGGREALVVCSNPENLPVGSRVKIAYGSSPQFRAAVLLFGLPVGGIIAGAVFGTFIRSDSVACQVMAAIVGGLLTFVPGFLLERRASANKEAWLPVVFSDNSAEDTEVLDGRGQD